MPDERSRCGVLTPEYHGGSRQPGSVAQIALSPNVIVYWSETRNTSRY